MSKKKNMDDHHSSVDPSAPTILRPRFESQAHHLRFYQFIFELCDVKMTKINKERPGMAHIKKEKHLKFTCNVIKICYGCGAM